MRLIRRYKRFLADVEMRDGERITVHCANTGAMTGCAAPGSAAWLSTAANPRRKYRYTLELVQSPDGELIAVNTARANGIVAEALAEGLLPGFKQCDPVRREVPIPGESRGRFDLLAGDTYIEVKTVTLKLPDTGAFPDAVSARATRHVDALARLARSGRSAALVFCVLHAGIRAVRPADEIDPAYGIALRRAINAGVRVIALGCRIDIDGIAAVGVLPFSAGRIPT